MVPPRPGRETIEQLLPVTKGDIIIDGGNSNFRIQSAARWLKEKDSSHRRGHQRGIWGSPSATA